MYEFIFVILIRLLPVTNACFHPNVKLHLHCNELTERMRNELQKMVIARQSEC